MEIERRDEGRLEARAIILAAAGDGVADGGEEGGEDVVVDEFFSEVDELGVDFVEIGEAFSAGPLAEDDVDAEHFLGEVSAADLGGGGAGFDPNAGMGTCIF